jgi:uncharacterized protein
METTADVVLERLAALDGLIVGFSGGVDSGLLSDLAAEALGDRAVIVTAVSPSLPSDERDAAADLAAGRGWRHREVATHELARPDYVENSPSRCFHCRTEFFDVLIPLKEALGVQHVAVGTVADDLSEHRPGQQAARKAGVLTPLADAGISKALVREIAKRRGLELWDKPASACLSSRIPYGTPVTVEALRRIELGERALKALGFADCRVRDHEKSARVEVPAERLGDALAVRGDIVAALKEAGYTWVALDLEGLRSGSMNAVLAPAAAKVLPVVGTAAAR